MMYRAGGGRSVAAVVVTFNAERDLPALLASLRASAHVLSEVVVVDNGSTDRTVEIASSFSGVRVVRQANLGFAAGINRGLAVVDEGCDVLVCNADVVVAPDTIGRLAAVLDDEPTAGLVAPRLLAADGSVSPSLRHDPSVLRLLAVTVLGGRRAGRLGEADAPLGSARTNVDWVTGAVMLLRREAIAAVGPFDESFFLYSEETEYCQRLRAHDYRVRIEPAATARHAEGDLEADPRLWALRAANRVRLYARTHGLPSRWAFRAGASVFEARRAIARKPGGALALRTLVRTDLDRAACALRGQVTGAIGPADVGWVCFSAQDWWYHNRAHSDFQLMRQVARSEPVLLVNSLGMRLPRRGRDTTVGRRFRRKLASMARFVRRPDGELPGFHVMTPVFLPIYGSVLGRWVNGVLVAAQVRAVSRRLGMRRPAVMVTLPTAWEAARRLRRRALVVNRSDRYSALPQADREMVRDLEERLLAEADVAVYTSHALLEEERALVGERGRYLGHGVDVAHFRRTDEHPALRHLATPRVGFFGGLDDYTVDLALLARLADHLPDLPFVLVGDANGDIADLVARSNVHWFGRRPYSEIPAFGSGFDVALMPWLDNEWIRYSSPIKLKEYLALGLPVVSTPFPELDHVPEGLVTVAAGAQDMAGAIRRQLAQDPQPERRRASVLGETWESKAARLQELVEAGQPCAE